jgi:hypothetical protein
VADSTANCCFGLVAADSMHDSPARPCNRRWSLKCRSSSAAIRCVARDRKWRSDRRCSSRLRSVDGRGRLRDLNFGRTNHRSSRAAEAMSWRPVARRSE